MPQAPPALCRARHIQRTGGPVRNTRCPHSTPARALPIPVHHRFAVIQYRHPFTHVALAIALMSGLTLSAAAQQLTSGVDTTNFDQSVRPQDDFFRYVNGGWLSPRRDSSRRIELGRIQGAQREQPPPSTRIIEEAAKSNAEPGSPNARLAISTPASWTGLAWRARPQATGRGAHAIAALKIPRSSRSTFAHFARLGVQEPIGVRVGPDPKQSDVNIVPVNSPDSDLPDRDYFCKRTRRWKTTRAAYKTYIARLLTLAKAARCSGAANPHLALETAIATPQWDGRAIAIETRHTTR